MHSPQTVPRARGALAIALAASLAACGGGDGDDPVPPAPSADDPPPPAVDDDAPSSFHFVDAASEAGLDLVVWCGAERDTKRIILDSIGQGMAWLDDDGDGALDLFVVNGSALEGLPDPAPRNAYYRNLGDGTFEDVASELGLDDDAWGNGVAAADYDNDGDTDLFVTSWGAHRLFENRNGEGGPAYVDVAAEAGVTCVDADGGPPPWGTGAAWGDGDLDGFLDLYVCHYLDFDPENPPAGGRTQSWKGIRDAYYGPLGCVPQEDRLFRNDGSGGFEDASASTGIADAQPQYTLGVFWNDLDVDGDPDLYVANDSVPNYLFVNDAFTFEERAKPLGAAWGDQGNPQAGMGLDCADWDGDGLLDIVVTNFDDDVNTLYVNRGGDRGFRDRTTKSGLAAPSRNLLCWGVGLFDFDLDGDRDLFIAAGHVYPRAETDDPNTSYRQRNLLLETRAGRFHGVSEDAGPAFEVREVSRGTAFGDYDADGDVDFVVSNLNRVPTLYRNDSTPRGTWFAVLLEGTSSNADGVGARVTVHAGGRRHVAERMAGSSFLSTNSPWLHFGLGEARRVESVEVDWPSGAHSTHGPFDVAERVVLREP